MFKFHVKYITHWESNIKKGNHLANVIISFDFFLFSLFSILYFK